MKILELFAGTGSVGKVAKELGHEVISLDRDMEADIKTDILDWNYKTYEPNTFDLIWASPPCTEYSIAKTTGIRKIEQANEIVKRTLEIIEYFQPRYFIIENPQTGLLKKQVFMTDIPFNDIDYCRYGLTYRKRTRLWNNISTWTPRPLCNKDCEAMTEDNKRHKETAQRMPSGKRETWGEGRIIKQDELYTVPSALIKEILISI